MLEHMTFVTCSQWVEFMTLYVPMMMLLFVLRGDMIEEMCMVDIENRCANNNYCKV